MDAQGLVDLHRGSPTQRRTPSGDGARRSVLFGNRKDGRQALGYFQPAGAAGALSARSSRLPAWSVPLEQPGAPCPKWVAFVATSIKAGRACPYGELRADLIKTARRAGVARSFYSMADLASPVERNIITILAVDMVGSTRHISGCDPEDAQSFLDLWFEHIRVAVERAGGLMVHFAGDGGIAMFGWPSSFEDHAERACRAAWDITQTGGATGPQGDAVQFRFDIAGTTVHLAAKLQQRARPGEAIVSAEVVKLCRSSRPEITNCESPASPDGPGVEAYRLN